MTLMIGSSKQIMILLAAVALLVSTAGIAEDGVKKHSPDAAPASQNQTLIKKSDNKPILSDVMQVSTADAARSAAHEAAKKNSKNQQKGKASDGGSLDSVLEFKPASQDEESALKSEPGITTKRARKNIHGEAYGSLDPTHSGNHEAGGAVGVGSKSGKTHVYVETDQSRSTSPVPH
ncbi:MAG: hypothetical protein ACYDA9_10515 [Terriglobia bacterium]